MEEWEIQWGKVNRLPLKGKTDITENEVRWAKEILFRRLYKHIDREGLSPFQRDYTLHISVESGGLVAWLESNRPRRVIESTAEGDTYGT